MLKETFSTGTAGPGTEYGCHLEEGDIVGKIVRGLEQGC